LALELSSTIIIGAIGAEVRDTLLLSALLKKGAKRMRRTILLLASMLLALLLASGMALAVTSSGEKPYGHRFEPRWTDEPIAPQEEVQLEAFANHWDSVTVEGEEETLYYYNPESVYPKMVGHAAWAWNALDGRFDGRGVRLIEVRGEDQATVLIDGIRDCKDRSWLGFAQYREDRPDRIIPDRLGVNTCALDRKGTKVRKHVLTHEMGHHLGSGHQPRRWCGKSIMVARVPCSRERIVLTRPGPRDVRWYWDRWVS
jgi:hypothetical protein